MIETILSTGESLPLYGKLSLSFFAGLLPVLVWLWFWEHEDKNPEPKKLVFIAFIAGMVATLVTLPFESLVYSWITTSLAPTSQSFTLLFILWAAIEELLKFAAAYVFVLRRTENDEPIDSMMYMITVALGFAALENMFFLFGSTTDSYIVETLMIGNMRFIGANLLHVIASSIIGFTLAFTYYRSKKARRIYVSIGVITAIVLHASFNLSIMRFEESLRIVPFYAVWIAIVVMLLAFEKIKGITKPSS